MIEGSLPHGCVHLHHSGERERMFVCHEVSLLLCSRPTLLGRSKSLTGDGDSEEHNFNNGARVCGNGRQIYNVT